MPTEQRSEIRNTKAANPRTPPTQVGNSVGSAFHKSAFVLCPVPMRRTCLKDGNTSTMLKHKCPEAALPWIIEIDLDLVLGAE